MTEEEYKIELSALQINFESAKRKLDIRFGLSLAIYKVGDIISDSAKTILIDKITVYKSFGLPEPVYNGPELKKDLTPKKSGEAGSIYGNHMTKLLKSSKEPLPNSLDSK